MDKELINEICAEHYDYCNSQKDNPSFGNLGYLWYLYTHGSARGTYKPFILFAETNLLVASKIITPEEGGNLINMLKSRDKENTFIAEKCIKSFRKSRIENLGKLDMNNQEYKGIEYFTSVLPLEHLTPND